MATVGDRLKLAREKRGMSQRELAKLAHLNHALISRLEAGERASLSLLTAKRLAEILGITTDYLAGMHEEAAARHE